MKVLLTAQPFDPAALLAEFSAGRTEAGGIVSFTGLVRSEGGSVEALELEAYEGFTEAAIIRIAETAIERFALQDVAIVHRTGKMTPGEPVVFVAAAAPHRRAAFEGADQVMDYLKSRAPFWKKSWDEKGEGRWIEPRRQDYEDAARWDAPEGK